MAVLTVPAWFSHRGSLPSSLHFPSGGERHTEDKDREVDQRIHKRRGDRGTEFGV